MKRPIVALLLSAFVLPGLGHLYWGQRNKAIALLLAVAMVLCLVACASKTTETSAASTSTTPEIGAVTV